MININERMAALNAERRAIRLDYDNRERAVKAKHLAEMNADIDLLRAEKNRKIDATYRKQDELVAEYRKEKREFYKAMNEAVPCIKEER
jgi:aspartyl/asparaginyl-tRNA synthetase